eukprot:3281369-Rhodomonas_salina.1
MELYRVSSKVAISQPFESVWHKHKNVLYNSPTRSVMNVTEEVSFSKRFFSAAVPPHAAKRRSLRVCTSPRREAG